MTGVVVDASVTLAWCFPDEISDYADRVLVALEGNTVLVPAIWCLEIANAVLTGERKKRLRQSEIRRFTSLLEGLPGTLRDKSSPLFRAFVDFTDSCVLRQGAAPEW